MNTEDLERYKELMAEAKRWEGIDDGYAESFRQCAKELLEACFG